MKPFVQLALPRREAASPDVLLGHAFHCSTQKKLDLSVADGSAPSLLNFNFNQLWARLHSDLRRGMPLTHWAILHDDIVTPSLWLDTLLDVMNETDADFVSANMPIKGFHGTMSMAVHDGDPWDFNRFTIRRLATMPDTFSSDEVNGNLLLNTGCCLLKLRDPWMSRPQDFIFQDQNRLRLVGDEWKAEIVSEDWTWTEKLRNAGAKLVATRRVGCGHKGGHVYRNDTLWGEWINDEAYEKRHGIHKSQVQPERELPAEQRGELAGV